MAFTTSKQQEDSRWVSQCMLLDNMFEMSKIMGSPYPGSMDGIEEDVKSDAPQAGIKIRSQGDPIRADIIKAAKAVPYNAVLYQAPPEFTMAHLNNSQDAEAFFEATPAQLSSLVPKIHLEVLHESRWHRVEFATTAVAKDFKNRQRLLLTAETKNKDETATEFVKRYLGEEYLAQGGIKRFEFNFDNNMFYERNIKATLELHFQSASDLGLGIYRRLFRLSDGPTDTGPSKDKLSNKTHKDVYQDMVNCAVLLKNAGIQGLTHGERTFSMHSDGIGALQTIVGSKKGTNIRSSLITGQNQQGSFRQNDVTIPEAWLNDRVPVAKTDRSKYLRCTIGWSDYNADIEGFGEKLANAVRNTQRTFVLNMTDYNVDYKEDGQVSITFNYIASIDSYTRQSPEMNILEKLFAKNWKGQRLPPEYLYSLVPVPSDEDIAKLYRPLAPYGFIGSNLPVNNETGVKKVTNPMDPDLVFNLNKDYVETITFNGTRAAGDFMNTLAKGGSIEKYATTVKTMQDGKPTESGGSSKDWFRSARRQARMKQVTGGGYIITRLVTQFEDPFADDPSKAPKVFQVQEKAIILEMSLIKKDLEVWRTKKRDAKANPNKPNNKGHLRARRAGYDNNISKLEAAYSVAKNILVQARAFRKIAASSGFFKSFEENNLLRMAKTTPATLIDSANEAVKIKDYKEGEERAKVDFFPMTDDASSSENAERTTAQKKYSSWAAKLASEKAYGNEKKEAQENLTTPIIDNDHAYIPFIQLGHLLSHMMGDYNNHPYHGLMLGTIKLPHPVTKKKIIYNISDIPISMPLLYNWYFSKVVDPERETYPFRTAMQDILTTIVQPILGKYCVSQYLPAGEKPPEVSFSTITVPIYTFAPRSLLHKTSQTTHHKSALQGQFDAGSLDPENIPKGHNFGRNTHGRGKFNWSVYDADSKAIGKATNWSTHLKGQLDPLTHWYVIYSHTPCNRSGDYNKDMQQGIFHLELGKDRGLLKRVSFQRKEMPYLESMNVENAQAGNLDGLLTIPMDATAELVGNNFFKHGQMIYINAEMGMGKALADNMRIGGYYMVTKVDNSIDSSGWTTKLKCIWQSTEFADTTWGGEP